MTSRQEILKTISLLNKPKPWTGETQPDPKNALKPKFCKCERPVKVDDGDGIGPRCLNCAKRLS